MPEQESAAAGGLEARLSLADLQPFIRGASTCTVYGWIAKGLFPRPVRLGPRMSGWVRSEIVRWQTARIAERDAHIGIAPSPGPEASRIKRKERRERALA